MKFIYLVLLSSLLYVSVECRGRRRSRMKKKDEREREEQNSKKKEKKSHREEKLFSIFSIVQFKNSPCSSLITSSGSGTGNRNGTCYTSVECAQKSGAASGSCAAGFGVCCVFLVSSNGGTISQNCTYIQNPGSPGSYADTSALSYQIAKCSGDVCALRLDFESFTTQGPADTLEMDGGVCVDTFTVTSNTNQNVPTICGENSGQHIYVEIGDQATDMATLNFAFAGVSSTRNWDIKVSQVPCGANYRQPDGCLQYHTGLTGRFNTFNFNSNGQTHLQNQDYSVCIRQEDGYCCVQYSACTDVTDSFSLETMGEATMKAAVDSMCTFDYIGISTSNVLCNQAQTNTLNYNRYCGPFFNTQTGGANNIPICDCTAPFQIDVFTDALDDLGDTAGTNTALSRGTCLTWTQIPCSS